MDGDDIGRGGGGGGGSERGVAGGYDEPYDEGAEEVYDDDADPYGTKGVRKHSARVASFGGCESKNF